MLLENGEKDKVLAELKKSYKSREYFMVLLEVDPRLDSLRAEARFHDLLRRVGFP